MANVIPTESITLDYTQAHITREYSSDYYRRAAQLEFERSVNPTVDAARANKRVYAIVVGKTGRVTVRYNENPGVNRIIARIGPDYITVIDPSIARF